jgi:pimeloyl-ACP methyl ester carboxylesterase
MKRETHFVHILLLLILFPLVCVNSAKFVLIHGGSHGAWCWYKVATMLKSAGHNVTTVELTASGINPIQVQDIHSISKYYEPLMTFMESLPPNEKVILVGHSLGGVSTSVAMEKFPHKISVAVFVTAYVLSQNLTYPAILQEVVS